MSISLIIISLNYGFPPNEIASVMTQEYLNWTKTYQCCKHVFPERESLCGPLVAAAVYDRKLVTKNNGLKVWEQTRSRPGWIKYTFTARVGNGAYFWNDTGDLDQTPAWWGDYDCAQQGGDASGAIVALGWKNE